MAREIILTAALLALISTIQASGFSLINNDHTNMPFMITLNQTYANDYIQADKTHLNSKQTLVARFLAGHSDHFHGLSMNDLVYQSEYNDKQLEDWSMHHYKQKHLGIEIFGGDLKVRFDHEGSIKSMSGVLLNPKELASLDIKPRIDESEAVSAVLRFMSILHPNSKSWSTEHNGIVIFKQGLTGQSKHDTLHLAFKITVESSEPKLLGYEVFVDAHSSEVLSHMSTIQNILHRKLQVTDWSVYPGMNLVTVWEESDPTTNITLEMQQMLTATKTVYTIFNNLIGYDSFDNNGTEMMAQYAPFLAICPNAFFRGNLIYACPGMAGLDVIAHEWGHAYISTYGGNLAYQSQSGALNEAYADIIGESTQLMMNFPQYYPPRSNQECEVDTTKTLRWILGEQVTDALPLLNSAGQLIGMRDMYNPRCYNNAASTSDSLYTCNPAIDNGGVHSNSGVPNQAYSLFVDGGNLNGITINGVGLIKAFNIYIRALGSHTSTTNFIQHAELLKQACMDFALNGTALKDPLTGEKTSQIVDSADCTQLQLALTATGLSQPVDCSASNAPLIVVPPPIGAVLKNTSRYVTISFAGINFNATNATLTATELKYGLNFTTGVFHSKFDAMSAMYYSEEVLKPSVYSVKIDYLDYTFGPFNYQTFNPAVPVKITPDVVQSNISSWIEIELAEPIREFKGCFPKLQFSSIFGDCMQCVFGMLAISPAYIVDETHIRCQTPSYIPSNITVKVSLSLGLVDIMDSVAYALQVKFLDLNNSQAPVSAPVSVSPVSAPVGTSNPTSVPTSAPVIAVPVIAPVHEPVGTSNPTSVPTSAPFSVVPPVGTSNPTSVPRSVPFSVVPPVSSAPTASIPTSAPMTQPSSDSPSAAPIVSPSSNPAAHSSSEINPWIIGSIAFAIGVALATGVTSVVCLKKAARKNRFEQL